MALRIAYDLSAHRLVTEAPMRAALPRLRRAGVGTLYLFGYFYGHFESSEDEMAQAFRILREEGFDTGAIHLPCGHGGNALDPRDPTLRLAIGKDWQMRGSADGRLSPEAACIDDVMTADNRRANDILWEMGCRRIFYDDDLRLGLWGSEMRGCFCPRCMERFSARAGRAVSRAELLDERNGSLRAAWMDFQCEKIPRFLRAAVPAGMQSGIMVMHNGDRRHGIDIPAIRAAMPGDFLLRVGEGHFDDAAFLDPRAEASLTASILTHEALFGDVSRCFSESTVFPANALSPENWIRKMELEIRLGLRNLFLMSGTWFFTDPYWDALTDALPRLTELAETAPPQQPVPLPFVWQI